MAGTTDTGRGGRRTIIAAINVTPLVDVVLVLLVIMMVASTVIVAQTLKVELPRTKTSDGTVEKPTILTILENGTIHWDGAAMAETDVPAAIREALKSKNGDLSLVISADRNVAHGRVVEFIDLARSQGVRKFAINVESSE